MIDKLANILGPKGMIREEAAMQPFLREWRDAYVGRAQAVLLPQSSAQVSEILKLAQAHKAKIVTQGGNTGLTGAQIPFEAGDEFVLSLSRMKAIRLVDAVSDAMIAEAGVTLLEAQKAAAAARRLFPLSLASEGSASIGGTISTNAGGTAVITYGNMRELVLGLEVVLANGEIWNGLKRLRKDNSGYDLKQMFIGAEGTLGIITAASLRLFPAPMGRAVGLAALASPAEAVGLYAKLREKAGLSLTALELMPRLGIELMMKHKRLRDPLAQASPWYVLIELSGAETDAHYADKLATLIPGDGVIAQSEAQADALWALREGLSEAQKLEGPSIKHDVSVPLSSLAAFVEETLAALGQSFPQVRPLPFGHAGDGNLHFNVCVPQGFTQKAEVSEIVHSLTLKHEGSIAAEHGVGRMKRELLAATKSPVEMEMMRGLKRMLDPANILNPGKVV